MAEALFLLEMQECHQGLLIQAGVFPLLVLQPAEELFTGSLPDPLQDRQCLAQAPHPAEAAQV